MRGRFGLEEERDYAAGEVLGARLEEGHDLSAILPGSLARAERAVILAGGLLGDCQLVLTGLLPDSFTTFSEAYPLWLAAHIAAEHGVTSRSSNRHFSKRLRRLLIARLPAWWAAEALAALGDRVSMAALLFCPAGGKFPLMAAERLGREREDPLAATRILRRVLSTSDGEIRQAIVAALEQLAGSVPLAVAALVETLDDVSDTDEDVTDLTRDALKRLSASGSCAVAHLSDALERRESSIPAVEILAVAAETSPVAIRVLRAALSHGDELVRVIAARALSGIEEPGPDVLGVLVEALRPGDYYERRAFWESRWIAAMALNELGRDDPEIRVALYTVLHDDEDPHAAIQAAQALRHLDDPGPETIDALRRAIDHPHWAVRDAAIRTIGVLAARSAAARTLLCQAVEAKHSEVRHLAVDRLIRLDAASDEVIAALRLASADKEPEVRHLVADTLRIRGEPALDTFATLDQALDGLDSVDADVREAAITAFVRLGDDPRRKVSTLLNVVSRSTERLDRQDAARTALRRIIAANPDAIEAVHRALEDGDWRIRWTAAEELAALEDTGVGTLAALRKALVDQDSGVRHRAIYALEKKGGASPDVVTILLGVLRSSDPERHRDAVLALGRLAKPTPEVLAALFQVAINPEASWTINMEAVFALEQLAKATPEALAMLHELVRQSEAHHVCRKVAADALLRLHDNSPDAIDALWFALKNPSPRRYAHQAVANAFRILAGSQPAAAATLRTALCAEDESISIAAAGALIQLQDSILDSENLAQRAHDAFVNATIRHWLFSLLAQMAPARRVAISVLRSVLMSSHGSGRIAAAEALCTQGISDDAVLDGLRRSLSDPERSVRYGSAAVLGRMARDQLHVLRYLHELQIDGSIEFDVLLHARKVAQGQDT